MEKRKRMDKRIEKRVEQILVSVLGIALVVCMIIGIISLVRSYTGEEATVEELQAQIATLNQQLQEMEAKLQAQQPLALLSPNGGEECIKGETYNVAWTSMGVDKVNIELENWEGMPAGGPTTWIIAENVSASLKKYSWTIPENIQSALLIQPGNCYKIRVVDASDTSAYSLQVADSSDGYFAIKD